MSGIIKFIRKGGRIIPIMQKQVEVKTATGLVLRTHKVLETKLPIFGARKAEMLANAYEKIRRVRAVTKSSLVKNSKRLHNDYVASRVVGKQMGAIVAKALKGNKR
jgi:hypothetical protein